MPFIIHCIQYAVYDIFFMVTTFTVDCFFKIYFFGVIFSNFKFYQEHLDEDDNEVEDPLIFFKSDEISMMRSAKRWLADGTWKARQDTKYEQVWILSTVVETTSKSRNHAHPLIYVYMIDMSEAAYTRVLKLIEKLAGVKLDFHSINCDMELSVTKAIRKWSPNVKIHFCDVHIIRAWAKRAKKMHIYAEFFKNGILKKFWRVAKARYNLDGSLER